MTDDAVQVGKRRDLRDVGYRIVGNDREPQTQLGKTNSDRAEVDAEEVFGKDGATDA